eukprot:2030841-Lingulodinium_polyedra.AAC.1
MFGLSGIVNWTLAEVLRAQHFDAPKTQWIGAAAHILGQARRSVGWSDVSRPRSDAIWHLVATSGVRQDLGQA